MHEYFSLDLQFFADGDGGTEAGTSAETTATEAAEGTEQVAEAQTERDYETEFDNLIKGDFKDVFQNRTQKIIDKRFKSAKQKETELSSKLEKLTPLLDAVSLRYGVSADDPDTLVKAITDDDAYVEYKAMQEGKSVDEVRNSMRSEVQRAAEQRELQTLRERDRQRIEEEQIRTRLNDWSAEGESIKSIFPEYDFATTIKNEPEVVKLATALTQNGFNKPFESAYKQIHSDEMMTALASAAAKKAAKATADSIAAGNRPSENGASNSVGAVTKTDVSQLTNKDIYSILKRVERGEKISF